MSWGYWIVQGDKTTCGGIVLEGHPNGMMFAGNRQASSGCKVSCGKHAGTYSIGGGHPGDFIHGTPSASTLYSRSTCPCRAFFIPSQKWAKHGLYQAPYQQKNLPEDQNLKPSSYVNEKNDFTSKSLIGECTRADDVLSNGVYVWTERVEAGHSYISIHKDNHLSVFTYGRFGRTGTGGVSGDGILIYLQGEDARNYFRHELYKMNARVFLIGDADIEKTYQHFYSLWEKGSKPTWLPKNAGDATKVYGRIIDVYDLSSSNCTTHTVQGLKIGGSKIFNTSYTPIRTQYPIDREESFVIPLSLEDYLDSKKHDFSSLTIVEMTKLFKDKYPNINNAKAGEKGIKQSGYEAGTQSLSTIGSSGISFEESGGIFGSTFDTEITNED